MDQPTENQQAPDYGALPVCCMRPSRRFRRTGIGGIMLGMHLSRQTIFLVSAVPELIAAVAILALMYLERIQTASGGRTQPAAKSLQYTSRIPS
jgi:hypothetical protein